MPAIAESMDTSAAYESREEHGFFCSWIERRGRAGLTCLGSFSSHEASCGEFSKATFGLRGGFSIIRFEAMSPV